MVHKIKKIISVNQQGKAIYLIFGNDSVKEKIYVHLLP